jgi:hypothetical protein
MAQTSVARFPPRSSAAAFLLARIVPMRSFLTALTAIVIFSLEAAVTFAQVPARTPPILSPSRPHDSGVGGCMEMWDSGTHMTKQQWSRACERVQTRLDSVDVDAIMRVRKMQR